MKNSETFNFNISITIANCWIEDGFSKKIAKERIKEFVEEDMLPYASLQEVEVKIK